MTENFWLETIRIIGGILTLIITGYIAIKQVSQGKKQQELKEGQTKLKEEIDGHMTKLLAVSNQVHEEKGKISAELKIPGPVAPIELKIGKLEVELKPTTTPPNPKK